jgi:F-type H+-transporting ATPase subunit delta
MAKLITKTYGQALFEIAVEKQLTDSLYGEAIAVRDLLAASPELVSFLGHPDIENSEKVQVVENIFSGRVSPEMTGFLRIVVSKGRYTDLNGILDYFFDRVKEYQGIGTAYVSSAAELTEEQKTSVEKKLVATTKYESFETHYSVDPSLIGGIVIRVGDKVVDGSVRHKLNQLQQGLSQIQLAKE